MEDKVAHIRNSLKRGECCAELGLILLEQAVQCILHMENRVSERILYVLLFEAISRYGDASSQKAKALIAAVTQVVQTRVLGTPTSPSQWVFPLSKDKTTVVMKSLEKTIAQKLISNLQEITEIIFSQCRP